MMKLSLEQIKSIALGVEKVEEKNGHTYLFRFTEAETELYNKTSADFYKKTFATAGISLEFTTNSSSLSMKTEVASGSSRHYFCHKITVNGKDYTTLNCKSDTGVYSGSWCLPEGDKTVRIYFPWSVSSVIHSIVLDDGATLIPVEKKYTMVSYGDSITHGYDASSPELSYASKLADALCANSINKGIGGEVFRPELAALSGENQPDIITVAYGVNDWCKWETKEEFIEHCRGFYENLSKNNPKSRIFALTPVSHMRWNTETKVSPFTEVTSIISGIVEDLENVTLIDGFSFIPADAANFSADGIHPNDKGFEYYADGAINQIKKYL